MSDGGALVGALFATVFATGAEVGWDDIVAFGVDVPADAFDWTCGAFEGVEAVGLGLLGAGDSAVNPCSSA
jgi:hypothetical protein